MKDQSKTKQELLEEISALKQKIQKLEDSKSERKRIEKTLKENEDHFRMLRDITPLGISLMDIDGRYEYLNPAFVKIFGYDLLDIPTGKEWFRMAYPDTKYRRKVITDWKKDLSSSKTLEIRPRFYEVRCKGGVFKTILFSPVTLPSGKQLIIYEDITESKRVEEIKKENDQKLHNLTDNLPNAMVYQLTEEPRGGRRFIYVSRAVERLNEVAEEEVLADASVIYRQVLPEYQTLVRECEEKALENMTTMQVEVQSRLPSGRLRWFSYTSTPRLQADGLLVWDGVEVDITERKQAEEALWEREHRMRLAGRIEQAREEEKVMISREIHDVMGGGLAGLKMDLSWLMNKMKKAESDKERTAMVNRILSSSETVDKMINVTRRISTELRPPVLDDLGLIAALEWQLSEFTSRTGILHKFTTAIEYVNIERDQSISVFRIFQEALTNIARHSGATKAIIILREDGRNLSGDENLVLEIRDNGRGFMDEEILNKKTLGLLGMKERAMAFGGELSIFGEPGEGTSVVLKIPRKRGEPS